MCLLLTVCSCLTIILLLLLCFFCQTVVNSKQRVKRKVNTHIQKSESSVEIWKAREVGGSFFIYTPNVPTSWLRITIMLFKYALGYITHTDAGSFQQGRLSVVYQGSQPVQCYQGDDHSGRAVM